MRNVGILLIAILTLINSAEAGKRLVIQPYEFRTYNGFVVAAEFGKLRVPENRNDNASREIELALVRFRSTSPNPGSSNHISRWRSGWFRHRNSSGDEVSIIHEFQRGW